MGQKVHPVGFRLGYTREWEAKWFAEKDYAKLLHEDLLLRKTIRNRLVDAGIPRIEIERSANQLSIRIHTARPGIVIGKNGQKVEELRRLIEGMTGKKVRINIEEIRQPETNAYLVGHSIAEQIQHRVAYKRAIKQAAQRAMQRGAKGVKIVISGRLGGAEMSRRDREVVGKVPLQTLRADIDFATSEALTTYGLIGIKVWIYRGDVIPPPARTINRPQQAVLVPQQPVVVAPEAETAAPEATTTNIIQA